MQVSKGLKRATGRGEQVQHHLGTLSFCGHFGWSMASSPKVSRLNAPCVPVLGLDPDPGRFPLQRKSRDPRSWTLPEIPTTIV